MTFPEKPLAELCEKPQYGFTARSSPDGPGPLYLRVTDVRQSHLDWESVPRCETTEVDKEKYLLRAGDIVIARSGSVGFAKQIRPDAPAAIFASYLVRFRPRPELVDPRYLGEIVESEAFRQDVERRATGAAQPNANARVLGATRIPVPPLKVQRKIAAVLAAYDELIENNLRRIEILEEMAQAVYREWFVNFRYPGHESVPLVDSPLGPIPDGWGVSTLGDVSIVVMGQSPKSEFYNDTGDGLPFHQGVSNFGSHFPVHSKYCTVETRVAEPDDLLVSVRAPVGRINVADTRLVIGRGLAAVRPVDPFVGFHYRQLRYVFREEDAMGGGTIYKAITKGDLLGIQWLVPPAEIKAAFDAFERPMFKLISNLTQQNRNLRSTRDLLLPKLVSGEIDVSDLDIDTDWLVA